MLRAIDFVLQSVIRFTFDSILVFLAAFLIPLRTDGVYKHFHNLFMILPFYSLYGGVLSILTNSSVNTHCHVVDRKSFCEMHNRCCGKVDSSNLMNISEFCTLCFFWYFQM